MKPWLIHMGRYAKYSVYSLAVTLAISAPAWAQEQRERPKPSWVMSYLLVMICVGLGLFVVCRGSKRFK